MDKGVARFVEVMSRRGERVEPLYFVAHGDEMEADARKAFAGSGVVVIRSQPLQWSADLDLTKW